MSVGGNVGSFSLGFLASSGQDTNIFNHLREKRERQVNALRFLVRCKNSGVIPKFIKVKTSTRKTPRINRTLQRCHTLILRTVIKDTRSYLAKTENQLYNLHLQLSNTLHPILWNIVDHGSYHRTVNISDYHQAALSEKHKELLKAPKRIDSESHIVNERITFPPPIVNLSQVSVPSDSLKILELGLNCAISNQAISPDSIIAPLERCFKNSRLHPDQLSFLRSKVKNVIMDNLSNQKYLVPSPNLSNTEMKALNTFKKLPDILTMKADKGGQTVIIQTAHYNTAVIKLLQEGPYKLISSKRNPVLTCFNKVKKLIDQSSFLTDSEKFKVMPHRYNAARLYALPKLHKSPLSYRPIISGIGTPTAILSKFLANSFSPLLKFIPHTVLNSTVFVEKIRTLDFTDKIMISLDVKSMFTNIPINEALLSLK